MTTAVEIENSCYCHGRPFVEIIGSDPSRIIKFMSVRRIIIFYVILQHFD